MTNKAPVHRLKKNEIIALVRGRCPHGHTYLEHYSCYKKEPERVGFLDIEASNLDADFGIMLSWCIKDGTSGETIHDVITLEDIQKAKAGCEDKRITKSIIKSMLGFDRIVGYYSSRFDIPYIRTRAMATGVKFPDFGTLNHLDLYYAVRYKFKLSRNSQENACRVLLGKTDKTRIEAKYWRGAARGDKSALRHVLDHNKKDVLDLEKLYHAVLRFTRRKDTSI